MMGKHALPIPDSRLGLEIARSCVVGPRLLRYFSATPNFGTLVEQHVSSGPSNLLLLRRTNQELYASFHIIAKFVHAPSDGMT